MLHFCEGAATSGSSSIITTSDIAAALRAGQTCAERCCWLQHSASSRVYLLAN
jgi:hypothetical protein